ncbi:MAG: phosphatase PAP2 family protein [Bacteroidaceae bacterium]|nr:phosphatase PAP2 family protein [Bacteroidaceae bacterium]
MEQLIDADKYLLLGINGSESLFWDACILVYTSTVLWIPLALVLLFVLIKNNTAKNFLILLGLIVVLFFLTDGITSTICKPYFARLRPTHDPELMYAVDVVNGYRAGLYSFMSSHAGNSFGIATFVMLLVRNRTLSISLAIWAILNSYTRLYLGVHFPGDIIAGTTVGILSGVAVYYLYRFIFNKQRGARHDWVSSQYTKSGYLVQDVHLMLTVLYATFALIPIIAFFKLQNF